MTCDHCQWGGESKDLIVTDQEVKDPRAFDDLSRWFAVEGGSTFALLLNKYGFLPKEGVASWLNRKARVYIAGLTEAILDPTKIDEVPAVYNNFAFDFAKMISPDVLRKMVQLGIFEKDADAKNIMFMSSVSAFGFRKLWEALAKEQRN